CLAPTDLPPASLHDALPICSCCLLHGSCFQNPQSGWLLPAVPCVRKSFVASLACQNLNSSPRLLAVRKQRKLTSPHRAPQANPALPQSSPVYIFPEPCLSAR